MTVAEAIARADAMYPDTVYTTAQKAGWLYELDGQLWESLLRLYRPEADRPEEYTAEEAATRELLIEAPHGEIYAMWLVYKYLFRQGESQESNDMANAYNAAMREYRAWYVRNHRELNPPVIRLWR